MAVKIDKKLVDVVHQVLLNVPQARDNDEILCVKCWVHIHPNLKQYSFADFCLDFKAGKVTSFESISRARRKLQELHPVLRGEKWHKRHAHQEHIIQQIKSIEL